MIQSQTERVLSCWHRLESQLADLSDLMSESLRAGAGAAEIRDVEARLGSSLPLEVAALYRLHDGQRPFCPESRRTACLFFHRDTYRWLSLQEMATASLEAEPAMPGWLPVATAATGDLLYISRESGAVVERSHDREGPRPVADSLAKLLCDHAEDLEEGCLVEAPPGQLGVPEVPRDELDRLVTELFSTSPGLEEGAMLRVLSEKLPIRPRWFEWRYGRGPVRKWRRLSRGSGP